MKVSTDGVVLGAMASHSKAGRILDIGTGTGLIALMLAQRFPTAAVEGIEIDKDAYLQASDNLALSPWKDRVSVVHQSFQEFAKVERKRFDLIVSNPPYFPAHLKSGDLKRNLALHNDALPFPDLVRGIPRLLSRDGLFWVMLPERQMQELETLAMEEGLFPHNKIIVRNHPSAPVLRVVQAFSFLAQVSTEASLLIRDQDRNYSKDYKELLKDFLLDF